VDFARYAGAEQGHRAVIDGAKALAMTALDVLGNPDLVRAMQAAFTQTAARKPVVSDQFRTTDIPAPAS